MTMTLEELTIERVEEAYKKHNHRPDENYGFNCHQLIEGYIYYCPLQVMAAELGLDPIKEWSSVIEQSNHFYHGFDGYSNSSIPSYGMTAYKLGRSMRDHFVGPNKPTQEQVNAQND